MVDKIFNTRIQLKFDTEEQWKANNPALKKGEVAVVAMSDGKVRLKVGTDGIIAYNNLPWVTSTYAAADINGLADFIQNNDAEYQLVADNASNGNAKGLKLQKKEYNGDFTDVGTVIDFSKAMTDAANTAKTAVIGGDEDASSANTIKGAKKHADEVALATVKAMLTSEVAVADNQAVTGMKIDEAGKLVVSTVDVTKMPGVVSALAAKQDTLNFSGDYSEVNTVVTKDTLTTELGKKQDNLKFHTDYNAVDNQVATMADVKNSVEGLSGAMHYIGVVAGEPEGTEIQVTGKDALHKAELGDVVVNEAGTEYVYSGAGQWRELGSEQSYIVKGNGCVVNSYINAAEITTDKVSGLNAEIDKIKKNGESIAAIDGRLGKAETSVADHEARVGNAEAVIATIKEGSVSGSGKVVTDMTVLDGKVTATKGNVDVADLTQVEGNTLILACGDSTGM